MHQKHGSIANNSWGCGEGDDTNDDFVGQMSITSRENSAREPKIRVI